MRFKGKTALITGASRNQGKAITLAFAREGADVIIIARESKQELEAVAEECRALGVQAMPVLIDITDHQQVNRMVQEGLEKFGKIDILVSTVGYRPKGRLQEISYEQWHRTIAVDMNAPFYLCKAIVPGMMERRSGVIITLGGGATFEAKENAADHAAAKHGLAGFTKSLAKELGPYGIRVNLLNVSGIDTERRNPEWYRLRPHGGNQHHPAYVSSIPLGRPGRVDEVASVALFLASDEASFVTGTALLCSGGRHI